MGIDNENTRLNLIHAFSTQNAAGGAEGVPGRNEWGKTFIEMICKWKIRKNVYVQ